MTHRQMIVELNKKMTFEQIGDRLHCCKSTVHYWVEGKRCPGYHMGKAIEGLYKKKVKKSS